MLSKKLEDALNTQLNAEMYSSYLYLSMAAWFESKNLPGFAHWLKVQTQEEMVHALKFYNYLRDRQGTVKLKAIDGPAVKWESPTAAFDAVYKHEQKVTGLINNLMDLAIVEKDHAAKIFLDWFVNEQVEEESSSSEVLQKLKMVGENSSALFVLDQEMAARVFNLPPDMAEWAPATAAGAGA
jgi:ferritin